MKILVMFLALLCLGASSALAGPNAGGTIVVHNPNLVYSAGSTDYCGQGTIPVNCFGVNARMNGSTLLSPMIWKVYAAFPRPDNPDETPRLKAMTFGIHYPTPGPHILAHGACHDALVSPGPGWPGSDTGTALNFPDPQTDLLVECYWFAGYDYLSGPPPQLFCLRGDPVLGGQFADDSIPPLLDPIDGYGCMGFNQDGSLDCPPVAGYDFQVDGRHYAATYAYTVTPPGSG